MQIAVDGGSYSNVTTTTSATPAWTTAWTGTEGWHDVIIRHPTGYSLSTDFNLTEMLRITGTDGNEQIALHPWAGDYNRLLESPFTTYGIATHLGTFTANGYAAPNGLNSVGTFYGRNASVRRKATWATGARIFVWSMEVTSFALKIDGAHWGNFTTNFGRPSGHGFMYADLPGSGTHEIEIVNVRSIDAIMISDGAGGSTAFFPAEAVTPKTHRIVMMGDSQTQGGAAGQNTASTTDSLLAIVADADTYNVGISGNKISEMTPRVTTDVVPHSPNMLIMHGGYNAESTDVDPFPLTQAAYGDFLDEVIAELPTLDYIFCMLINDSWSGVAARNLAFQNEIDAFKAANPSWASKIIVIPNDPAGITTDSDGHITSIGYCQIHGENTGVVKITANPVDGSTVTMTGDSVTKVFEFDNNATVTPGNIAVTIGANLAASNLNLFRAIWDEVQSGWGVRPLARVSDTSSTGVAVMDLTAVSVSGSNLSATGPFADGVNTAMKAYIGEWPDSGAALSVVASADPATVTGTTTNLTATPSDGTSPYSYAWAVTTEPSVGAAVFDDDAIAGPTVTFSEAGSYEFEVTVTDDDSATATDTVSVTVEQTATGITVSPGTQTLFRLTARQFSQSQVDQFGDAMDTPEAVTWSVDGGGVGGSVNSSGLYTAPGASGSDIVRAITNTTAIADTSSVTVVAEIVSPLESQVLQGIDYGPDSSLAGTVVLPSVGDVREGVTFGASSGLTGTLVVGGGDIPGNYPEVGEVLAGVVFGDASELTGTYVEVAVGDVRDGTLYGPASSLEGTLVVSGGGGGGSPLEGDWAITRTFETAGGDTIQGVRMSLVGIAGKIVITGTNGVATIMADDNTFTLRIVPPAGYEPVADTTVTIDGADSVATVILTPTTPPVPPSADACILSIYVRNQATEPFPGVTVTGRFPRGWSVADGSMNINEVVTDTTDANGLAQLALVRDQDYDLSFARENGTIAKIRIRTPDAATATLNQSYQG